MFFNLIPKGGRFLDAGYWIVLRSLDSAVDFTEPDVAWAERDTFCAVSKPFSLNTGSDVVVVFPQRAAGYRSFNFSMVWLWIGVLVLLVLLPCWWW